MATIELVRRVSFSSAHRLHSENLSSAENLRVFGKCNNLHGHGHNYVLEASIRGKVDPATGMLMNLTDLKTILTEEIERRFDHKHLNHDTEEFRALNPTAENVAIVCWKLLSARLPGLLYEVRLRETENNLVVYRGE